jgi:integration host factor subunit alpha
MTKADLVRIIFEKVGLPKVESQKIIETIFETMKQTLSEGESVKISGFGTFNVKKKRERRGRNPQTGEDLQITARKVVIFKPSNILKDLVERVNV